MSGGLWRLPAGWVWAPFRDVADVELELVDAKRFPKAVHIAPNHIESGTARLIETGTVAGDKVLGPKHQFREGHILYSKIRPYLAKAVLAPCDGFCSSDMYPVTARFSPRYLLNWLVSPAFTERVSRDQGRTVLPKVNLAALNELPVPVAPLNEQRRIVAKLEALQTRSRRAREALDAVPPLLEKLRQSILAAAFRGDLTKDWRAAHPDIEPASELLRRIRIERRKKWEEAELAKLKAKGKAPTDDRWKAKYVEPQPVDPSGLPELPEGWCWASVEELASDEPRSIQSGPFGSNLLHSEFKRSGILVIGIDNVQDGAFSMGSEHRISERKFRELEKYTARHGDVLITVMATVGRCCTVPDDLEPAIITKHVYRVSPDRGLVCPAYLMQSIRGAPALRNALHGDVRGQTRPGINGEIIRSLPVPLTSIGEQRAILASLDVALAAASMAEAHRASTREQLGQLDRALLAKAFRGELVAQDPNDEPAEVMLARLRAPAPEPEPPKPSSKRRSRPKARAAE